MSSKEIEEIDQFNDTHTEFIGKIPSDLIVSLSNLVECFNYFKLKSETTMTSLDFVASILDIRDVVRLHDNSNRKLKELKNLVEQNEKWWINFIELLRIFNNYVWKHFYEYYREEQQLVINATIKAVRNMVE
jgi:hypothetical protein